MKLILSNSWHAILRFDEGDDVIAGVLEFASKEGMEGAWLSAIGSTKEIELAYYDAGKKEYINKIFAEPLELVDASGTIAIKEGKPIIHWHGVASRLDYTTIGGHINKMIANMTIEVFIHKLNEKIEREHDEKTGLKLLK